jgi:hypothetical protein
MPNTNQDEHSTLATLTNIIGLSAIPLLYPLFWWKSDRAGAIHSLPFDLGATMVLLACAACGDWLEKRFHRFAKFVELLNTPLSHGRTQSMEGIIVLMVCIPIGYVIAAVACGGSILTLCLGAPTLLFLGAWFNWERTSRTRKG